MQDFELSANDLKTKEMFAQFEISRLVWVRTSSRSMAMTGPDDVGGDVAASASNVRAWSSSVILGVLSPERRRSSSSLEAGADMAVETRESMTHDAWARRDMKERVLHKLQQGSTT